MPRLVALACGVAAVQAYQMTAPHSTAAACRAGSPVCAAPMDRRAALAGFGAALSLMAPNAAEAMVESTNPANNYYVRAASRYHAPLAAGRARGRDLSPHLA